MGAELHYYATYFTIHYLCSVNSYSHSDIALACTSNSNHEEIIMVLAIKNEFCIFLPHLLTLKNSLGAETSMSSTVALAELQTLLLTKLGCFYPLSCNID